MICPVQGAEVPEDDSILLYLISTFNKNETSDHFYGTKNSQKVPPNIGLSGAGCCRLVDSTVHYRLKVDKMELRKINHNPEQFLSIYS